MKTWQPTASLAALEARAAMYQCIRDFFATRQVLEVDTPLLSAFGVTDLHLDNIEATVGIGAHAQTAYLQTSPEYAMKRLLAQHGKAIYQLSKAFRQDELGRYHNPEFTLLEWYRPGFTQQALMDEVDALVQTLLGTTPAERITYQQLFQTRLGIDPLHTTAEQLLQAAAQHGLDVSAAVRALPVDELLQLLMSHCIELTLGLTAPVFIYHYPRSQAALARLAPNNPLVADRFELYFRGVELANGFHELSDASEQAQRFQHETELRIQHGRPARTADSRLLSALKHGIPDCAGVALGIDRLLMLKLNAQRIDQVISFCWGNA